MSGMCTKPRHKNFKKKLNWACNFIFYVKILLVAKNGKIYYFPNWDLIGKKGTPPNFYLPNHHPKLLFDISTFLVQKELRISFFFFVS